MIYLCTREMINHIFNNTAQEIERAFKFQVYKYKVVVYLGKCFRNGHN